jgi:hypothetical protein
MADKLSADTSEDAAVAKLTKRDRSARYLRDRVVGDVVKMRDDGTLGLDVDYVEAIARVADRSGVRAFGYSHAWRRATAEDVARIDASGYVLNASCETVEDVAQALSAGFPATIASDSVEDGTMISGKRIVTCPAQSRDNVSCATCGLCAKPDRAAVVRFKIHGTARVKARASVAARETREGR